MNSRQILENSEALVHRKGPIFNDLGPFLYTQDLMDWLLSKPLTPLPTGPVYVPVLIFRCNRVVNAPSPPPEIWPSRLRGVPLLLPRFAGWRPGPRLGTSR